MAKQDLDALRRKYQERQEEIDKKKNGGGSGNTDFLKNFMQLKEGDNHVRFLPGVDDKLFYAETFIHQVKVGENAKNIHCLRVHGENCPLCELYFALWKPEKGGGEHYREVARSIKRRQRFYANIFDRDSKEVKILSYGEKLNDSLIGDLSNTDYEVVDPETKEPDSFLNVHVGYDYVIKKKIVKGEGNQTFPSYDGSKPRPKPSPLATSETEIKTILGKRHDIHGLVRKENYDEIKQITESIIATKAPTVTIFGRPASVVSDTESDEIQA